MAKITLIGRGFRIHSGKMQRKMYDRLQPGSEMSRDGSVDIWDYIDHNIAYGADPERFEVLIDGKVVTSNFDELATNFKLVSLPAEELPRRTDKSQNVILVEEESGEWAEQEIDNFDPRLLSFELSTFTLPTGVAYQTLTAHYDNIAFEQPDDLDPKNIAHFYSSK
jgi:hypothetical protein